MGLFTAWRNQEMTFQGEWTESREGVPVSHGGVQSIQLLGYDRQPQRIQDASHPDGRDVDDNKVGKLCFLFFACYHHGECSECCCILPEQRKN